ncbi:MAG: hypothetical protein HS115_16855 [Spirochaetales bacterium]|nr:hypothetical protein [Spirochaetales bacterium]
MRTPLSEIRAIILSTAVALVACGPKFEPFANPMMAVAFAPDAEFEILADVDAKPEVVGKMKGKAAVKALGLARKKIDGREQSYLKIECPAEIKCEDGVGYLPPERFSQAPLPEEFPIDIGEGLAQMMVILPAADAEAALKVRDWLLKPSNTQPALETRFVVATYLSIKEQPARMGLLYEVYLFLKAFDSPDRHAFKDPRLAPLLKKYRSLAELKKIFVDQEGRSWEVSPLFQWKVPTQMLPPLEKAMAEYEKNLLSGFPLRSTSWKGLAQEFNKENTPYIREKIFQKSLERANFAVEGNCPGDCLQSQSFQIAMQPLYGVSLQKSGQTVEIQSIAAEAGTEGLIFKLKTADGEIRFEPVETPVYLSIGGPGLRNRVAQIPGKWQDLLARYEGFKRPALEFAMKFGEGGYDAESGLMKYTIPKSMYWPFFELFRKSPHVQKTGQGYTGTVDGFDCYVPGRDMHDQCSWVQPKGYLNLRFLVCYHSDQASSGKECDKDFKEVTCAYTDSAIAEISFQPEQILHDQPELQIKALVSGTEGADPELCTAFFTAVAR